MNVPLGSTINDLVKNSYIKINGYVFKIRYGNGVVPDGVLGTNYK